MKANLISMNILVDSSGSMASIASDMVGGLNQLVDDNRELDVLVTYSIFSNEYQPIFADRPIKETERFQLRPSGSTALIESTCKMIDEVGARIAAKPEDDRPEKVMFVIVTDGEENASAPKYTLEGLKTKIKHQTEVYNWVFLYLGADQDAISVAERYGIAADKAVTYDKRVSRKTGDILSEKMRMMNEYSAARLQSIGFNAKDREDLEEAQTTGRLNLTLGDAQTMVNVNEGTIKVNWRLAGPGFNMSRLSDIEITFSVSGTGQYRGQETTGKTITGTFSGSGILVSGGTFVLTLQSSVIGTERWTAHVPVLDNTGRLHITGLRDTFGRVNTGTVETTFTITQVKAKVDGAKTATVVWTGSTSVTDSFKVIP
jgi:hypothetical protein